MDRKRKLLIVTRDQFGYHVDAYEYAKNLLSLYDITFFCWDYGLPKIALPGIHIVYASRRGNIFTRNIRFRFELLKIVRQGYDHIMLKYFLGISLVHLVAPQRCLICDIRTADVDAYLLRRFLLDTMMFLEVNTFRHISIISDCLARKLFLRKYQVLPLGANMIPGKEKDYSRFDLVYVGTFDGRKLADTVHGFKAFYDRHQTSLKCTYTIIGSGRAPEVDRIRQAIEECGLQNIIKMPGYIPHDDLREYFQQSNIGISYVPITGFFDCQPPTKTYEYLLAGMAVIATKTKMNIPLINEQNGVLIDDTAQSMAEGLEKIYRNRQRYSSTEIQSSMEPYVWENIVRTHLHGYLEKIYIENRKEINEKPKH